MKPISVILIDAAITFTLVARYIFEAYHTQQFCLIGTTTIDQEAIQLVHDTQPELALVDFHDPGIQVIGKIRQVWPSLVVLVLGNSGESIYHSLALRAGASDYGSKQQLNRLLDAYLAKRRGGEFSNNGG
ncbi:MAG: hypothetical protein Fur005_41770 [Roseiflexaceae bacterium]